MKKFSLRAMLEPLRSLDEPATRFALLTAVTVALYSMTDKLGVDHVDPILYVYLITVFVMIFQTFYVFSVKPRALIMKEWRMHPGMICVNGFITIFSYLLILIAFTFERMVYVTTIRQVSIVFGVLLGGHLLKEKHKATRFTAAAAIFAGAALIATAK